MTPGRAANPTRPSHGEARNGRAVPSNLDAESALLGSMMLTPSACEAAFAAQLTSASFYKPSHGIIFDAIRGLYDDGRPIDPVTVAAQLNGTLEQVGGRQALLAIQADAPASANATEYARIVGDLWRLRRLLAAASDLTDVVYDGAHTDRVGRALEALTEAAGDSATLAQLAGLELIDLTAILDGRTPEIVPTWLHRTDGAALIYPGRLNDFHAEPSVGKTWLALTLTAEVLDAGGNVVYLDYEDVASGTIGRLLNLGVDRAALHPDAHRFGYANPTSGIGPAERAVIDQWLGDLNPDVFIIDGVAEALVRDGLDETSNSDYVAWVERLPRYVARQGPAVVMLDHVKKDPKDRTRGARGAGAKLGAIDGASYEVVLAEGYSRDKAGRLRLKIAKDRGGQVGPIGEIAADVAITPDPAAGTIHIELRPHQAAAPAAKPTRLMERLSRALEGATTRELPRRTLLDSVRGNKEAKARALATLITDGHMADTPTGIRHLKPYREDAGPTDDEAPPDDGQEPLWEAYDPNEPF